MSSRLRRVALLTLALLTVFTIGAGLAVADLLEGSEVQVTLVKDGDHRLSRPQDLVLLRRTVAALLGEDGG